jgi:ABC-type sugar transport system ATPase subunit
VPQASLIARNATVTFVGVPVVDHVDIELRSGEIHAIVGENGAGKSSLAKAIAGVYAMSSGSLLVDDVQVQFKNPREALQCGITLIHQEPVTFPDLDVTENVLAGNLINRGPFVDHSACKEKTRKLLATLNAQIDPSAKVKNLSVAARQYVEIASALAHDARVWLFDETTAPLTPKEASELFDVMRRLRDQGCAIAFVSHHLHEVFAIADRITVLRDGKKVGETTPKESSESDVVRMMVGRDIERHASTPKQLGDTALAARNLTGPGFTNIELEVKTGEIVGLAGLVGAGRTELLRSLFGITKPASGTIEILGKTIAIKRPKDARRAGIALVPEDRIHDGLLMSKSVSFNSVLPNLDKVSRFGLIQGKAERERSGEAAKRLSLVHRSLEQPVAELSGGNQQKVVLGKWLMSKPKILLLDEPTRGVDVGAKSEVHKTVRELANQGIAVFVASSDLPELLALADRIIVMRQGKIVGETAVIEATEEKIIALATGAENG